MNEKLAQSHYMTASQTHKLSVGQTISHSSSNYRLRSLRHTSDNSVNTPDKRSKQVPNYSDKSRGMNDVESLQILLVSNTNHQVTHFTSDIPT